MAEVTDIKGVGPAKAETLEENGYATVQDIVDADADELADVDGVGEDRALEFIVEASNLLEDEEVAEDEPEGEEFDLTPSEVSEEVEEAEQDESGDVSDSSEEDEESPSEEDEAAERASDDAQTPEVFPISITFENRTQFDTFHAAVMRHHERHYTGNQPVSDAMEKVLSGIDDFSDLKLELSEEELNALHAGVSQLRTQYQGNNLIDHMDELDSVLDQINEQRREYLF